MEIEEDEITIEDLQKWVERLERFGDRFEEKDDWDNAKLMQLCSILMSKFALDVEVQQTSPFVMKAAQA
jgi:hypothetical protein